MREITLPVENPQLKVNGHVFDLRMTELEIYEYANNALEKYRNYSQAGHTDAETLSALRELVGTVDSILGEGATKVISGGRPVRMHLAILWLAKIAAAAAASYAEAIAGD